MSTSPQPMTPESPLQWIEQQAQELGFLDCKAVSLISEPNFPAFQSWLTNGHHGQLLYMQQYQDKRKDPRRLAEYLKSAIVFLAPYPKDEPNPYIAKYAWGKSDYHNDLKDKLRNLSKNYQAKWGALISEKICVDTAPLLERSLAERAGLGWIGKNGCLISRKHGSFTLIASWLTSLEVETEDNKHSFHCGTCTKCIELCPTQAFTSPGFLDADQCLSTQTIENRKLIPIKFHPHMKNTSFGCDICQDVCPWNRKHHLTTDKNYLPPLRRLLDSSEPEFRSHFRKKALLRPGWHGLRRNFLITAFHEGSLFTSTLHRHLYHPQEVVRKTVHQLLEIN